MISNSGCYAADMERANNAETLESVFSRLEPAPEMNFIGLDSAAAEAVYLYLFKGQTLREIEKTLFGASYHEGWFAKGLINYAGIESKKNVCGKFRNFEVRDVIDLLSQSGQPGFQRTSLFLSQHVPGRY